MTEISKARVWTVPFLVGFFSSDQSGKTTLVLDSFPDLLQPVHQARLALMADARIAVHFQQQNMRRSFLALMGLVVASSLISPAARADDDAKINARIEAWGRSCKNAVAAKYPNATMAAISVELGATLKQSIDAGQFTLNDIKQRGLSYNWTFKKHAGYCNTDGSGNVSEFVDSSATSASAPAGGSAKINARVEAGGRSCKDAVAAKYPNAVMSDISVQLSAADQKGIDSGEITLKQVNASGLSFNWAFKKHSGYCNTDGSGNVTQFVKGQ